MPYNQNEREKKTPAVARSLARWADRGAVARAAPLYISVRTYLQVLLFIAVKNTHIQAYQAYDTAGPGT